jgi:hypothetical protein
MITCHAVYLFVVDHPGCSTRKIQKYFGRDVYCHLRTLRTEKKICSAVGLDRRSRLHFVMGYFKGGNNGKKI